MNIYTQMNSKENLVEIKKGQCGTGILIENDGYISSDCGDNKKLFEEMNRHADGDDFHCPYPFIVSAVLQKYGIENANGRIYPENVLKREVEKYMTNIKERRAIGECYRPEAMILTESGWKHLSEVNVGENILTLNIETNEIEIQPIKNITSYDYDGDMINIKGRHIDDIVTPDHGFPLYNRKNKFQKFVTANDLYENDNVAHYYIPKTGIWVGRNDEYFTIPALTEDEINNIRVKSLKEKYANDLVIPIEVFAKFMGIYLSEGSHSTKQSRSYKVNIHQKKEDVCVEIEKMLDEWGIKYTINIAKKTGSKTFVISDMRLHKYISQFGLCYDKFVPFELKQQNTKILRTFYDWFVMGDGRKRVTPHTKNPSDDVFSTSKRLTLDLNEIQLKIGYCGTFLEESRNKDRVIDEGRVILGSHSQNMFFTYRSLTKGIYMDKRFVNITKTPYKGKVMCVEVDNHVWFVMDNNRCHWTKNCNHPAESVIDLSRVAMNIVECHWEGRTLVGKLEILTSPGFRKHGIISCQGDQVANLILQGIKIGISSRGLGTVVNRMGVMYVSDDYNIVCWDIVSEPSTPGSYIAMDSGDLKQYVESVEDDKSKNHLFEKIDKFSDWLND